MTRRSIRPEDSLSLWTLTDPSISPDGSLVAFVAVCPDVEADRLASSIYVVPIDGSSPPRPFSSGPADSSPRFSPDGRFLAYLSAPPEPSGFATVMNAPLEGGMAAPVAELPAPAAQFAWSPDSSRLAVVCRIGARDLSSATAAEKNAARVVRGLSARIDGIGWHDGRRHIVLVELEGGRATQLTRGEFDHDDPVFSPDGRFIVCSSDRQRGHDDRQLRSDAWLIPTSGGRAVRLTDGKGRVSYPSFSPDGTTIAFVGHLSGESWDEDHHLYVMPAEGGEPEVVSPDTDRGAYVWLGRPYQWTSDNELVVLLADQGSVTIHRARVGQRRSVELVGGDTQVDGLACCGRNALAFTAVWPDRPYELYALTKGERAPRALTSFNEKLASELELPRPRRTRIRRLDGTEVEYFTILPPGKKKGPFPLHLEIHGGPHGMWPSGRFLAYHQSIAGAGYAVVLPNPRGSQSYGQAFTAACTGDWGGEDFEDILACCDDLIKKGIADPDRMFVSGYSYGGFMTSWIVGHTRRFKAATAGAPVVDQVSFTLTADIPDFGVFNFGGLPFERRDEYEKRSPLTYLPDATTPVQVIHWEGDIRVPIGQGEELYTALRLLGKEAQLVRYPGGFHIARTPSQAVDWFRRTIAWDEAHDPKRTAARSRPASPARATSRQGGRQSSARRRDRTR